MVNSERVTDFSTLLPDSDYEPKDSLIIAEPGCHLGWREEFHRFRGRSCFGRYEGIDPARRDAEGERDQFDLASTFLIGMQKGVIRYGCRLINGEQATITLDPALVVPGRHFEISRFVMSRKIGDRATIERAIYTLCEEIATYAFLERGYDHLYSNTSFQLHSYFARIFGKYLEPLGAGQVVNKHDHALVLVPSIVRRCNAEAILDCFREKLSYYRSTRSRVSMA
jgi:N-acyl-L-homoserine lactone synthetase